MYRVRPTAASSPTTTPNNATCAPCRTNIRRTVFASAPRAMRTPISRVRRVAWYDSTPYSPTAPRTSANVAAMLTISIVNERPDIAFAARRSMVKIRYIGDSGMTSPMIARTSGVS